MNLDLLAQSLVNGILIGALYGLAAVGLSLVFGVLKVLNVAHGELLMLGGYSSFWLFTKYGLDPYQSLVLTVPILFVVGLVLHKLVFVHVTRFEEEVRIKNSMLIAFGLGLILHNLATVVWTGDERTITTAYSGMGITLSNVTIPLIASSGLVVSVIAILAVHVFLTRTYIGKAIRATAENWEAAALMGVNIDRAYLIAFSLGSALAGLAGILVTVSFAINPSVGLEWTLKALVVVVLAGLGSVMGALFGGIILGAVESGSVVFIGGAYREVVALGIFLLVLSLRPQGLFGKK